MDFKKIGRTILDGWLKFWRWLKPHLQAFRKWRKRIWKKYQINKILFIAALLTVIVMSVYLYFVAKSVKVSALKNALTQATVLYDEDDQEAGKLMGQKGTYISLDKMSPTLVDAVISTEDRRFYEHNGFDVKGIGRAFIRYVLRGNTSGGGGSTITQQLAKNAYLTQDQTVNRKAKELFMAIEIEKHYSKDEILAMYLNSAYFGNGVWGVEDASHRYFGKSAKDLSLSEAAVMAGMLKGPSIYNPKDYLKAATLRRNTVLDVMVDNGKITQKDCAAAKKTKIVVKDNYQDAEADYRYPYYFDAVIAEAEEKYDISSEDLLNKGYKIYTALNQEYQAGMEATFKNNTLFPVNSSSDSLVQGGSVAVDPKTGGVQAIVGGRGEHSFLGFNRGTMAKVQPGSTMKPIAVYTPALEEGWKSDDLLTDEALKFYQVQNYDQVYRGQVPMYQALYESLNASPIWLLHKIGLEKGISKAEQFGIPLVKKDQYYGMALGGLTKGVSPLQMAEAYTAFANEGVRTETHFITKIIDANGAVVADNSKAKKTTVTTKEVAEEMTEMMKLVFTKGTGVNAKPYGYDIAGKTGSTETSFESGGTKDQWVIGYTPDVVISTWIGYDESKEGQFLAGSSSTGVARVFKDEATRILAVSPQTNFSGDGAKNDSSSSEDEGDSDEAGWLEKTGGKIKDGAEYWGGKIKDGVDAVKDGAGSVWNSLFGD